MSKRVMKCSLSFNSLLLLWLWKIITLFDQRVNTTNAIVPPL